MKKICVNILCAIFESSAISAMTAFEIPIFPLNIPCTQRLTTNGQNCLERPKDAMAAASPRVPKTNGGFRPILSETRPHCSTDKPSAAKNTDSCTEYLNNI